MAFSQLRILTDDNSGLKNDFESSNGGSPAGLPAKIAAAVQLPAQARRSGEALLTEKSHFTSDNLFVGILHSNQPGTTAGGYWRFSLSEDAEDAEGLANAHYEIRNTQLDDGTGSMRCSARTRTRGVLSNSPTTPDDRLSLDVTWVRRLQCAGPGRTR